MVYERPENYNLKGITFFNIPEVKALVTVSGNFLEHNENIKSFMIP